MSIEINSLSAREIITKAVCGKGRKFSHVTHTVTPPHHPTSILGAWIINHQYEAVRSGDGIEVIGTYDINIWYSYDKNSQDRCSQRNGFVCRTCAAFLSRSEAPGFDGGSVCGFDAGTKLCRSQYFVQRLGVVIRVEREFAVELIAETKVWVAILPGGR